MSSQEPVRSIEEVRRLLAALPVEERCDPTCPGWGVFETNTERGTEIERCDDCAAAIKEHTGEELWDDDVEQLPEAIAALAEA